MILKKVLIGVLLAAAGGAMFFGVRAMGESTQTGGEYVLGIDPAGLEANANTPPGMSAASGGR